MVESLTEFVGAALERQAAAEEQVQAAELDFQNRLQRVLKFGKKLNKVARNLMYTAIDAGFDAGERVRHDYWFRVRHTIEFSPGTVLEVSCLGHWAAIGLGEDWRWSFGKVDMGPDGDPQTLENIKANLEGLLRFVIKQHLEPDPRYRPSFEPFLPEETESK